MIAVKRLLGWKRIATAFAVAALVVTGYTIYRDATASPYQSHGNTQPLPAAQPQQPGPPTDLQQMEQALGPFTTLPSSDSSTPDTQFPAVLLVNQDGSISASQNWTVPFVSTEWAEQLSPQISALTVTGDYVSFKVSTSTVLLYTIKVGQPFVLELVPNYVMYIDANGNQWSISTTRAGLARVSLPQH